VPERVPEGVQAESQEVFDREGEDLLREFGVPGVGCLGFGVRDSEFFPSPVPSPGSITIVGCTRQHGSRVEPRNDRLTPCVRMYRSASPPASGTQKYSASSLQN